MRTLFLLPLITFIIFGIASPFAMHEMDQQADCPLATFADASCFSIGTITDHISTIQGLLAALPLSVVFVTWIIILFCASIVLMTLLAIRKLPIRSSESFPFVIPHAFHALLRWRVRLVHSPTFAVCAAW